MASIKSEPVMLRGHRSHRVELQPGNGADAFREKLFPRFLSEWRGTRALVEMSANRYTHSSGVSEWRIVARGAYAVEIPPAAVTSSGSDRVTGLDATAVEWTDYKRGAELTDMARRRLGKECEPLVAAWLESEEYRESRAAAYAAAIRRELDSSRPTYDTPTSRTRALVAKYADTIGEERTARLLAACDAFDAYAVAYCQA